MAVPSQNLKAAREETGPLLLGGALRLETGLGSDLERAETHEEPPEMNLN